MAEDLGYFSIEDCERIRRAVLGFEAMRGARDERRGKAQVIGPIAHLVKIDTKIDGAGGTYNGTLYRGTALVNAAGNLELPQGLVSAEVSCVVVNADEDGLPTHWLRDGGFADGYLIGYSAEATPRPVVRIMRGQARVASPVTLGSGSERLTPDAATWRRYVVTSGTNYGDGPVEVWLGCGSFYDHTATPPVLKQHMRKFTIAADGRIDGFTAETDYVIDDPEAC